MPGTLSVRPIQANLTHVTSKVLGMDPYCLIKMGNKREHSNVCYNGGKHPHWEDTIVLDIENETNFTLELKDKTMLFSDSNIGKVELNFKDIENQKDNFKWYILMYNNEPAGEILMETFLDNEDPNNPPKLVSEQKEAVPNPNVVAGDNLEDEFDKYRQEEHPDASDQMWGINEVDSTKPNELQKPKVYNMPQAIPHLKGTHEMLPSHDFGQQEGIADIDFRYTVEKPHFVDSPQALPYQVTSEKNQPVVIKKQPPKPKSELGYQPEEYKNLVYKTDLDIVPQNLRDLSI